MVRLRKLLEGREGLVVHGPADRDIAGIACDSRRVRPGYLFAALPGTRTDGWAHVDEAVSRGAVAILAEHNGPCPGGVTLLRATDARTEMGHLAAAYHDHPSRKLRVVGVTGTNGKTTVTFMLQAILQAAGVRTGLLGTVEYRLGERTIPAVRTTPESVDLQSMLAEMVRAGCTAVAMETSSHAILQRRTVGIEFDVGVFTNLSQDHLDYHGTMDAYFDAKGAFVRSIGLGGRPAWAVLNVDDPWVRRLLDEPLAATALPFGCSEPAVVRATRIVCRSDGSECAVETPWGATDLSLRMRGRFNVYNALAALASAGALGVDLATSVGVLRTFHGVPGRMEEVPTGRGFQVYVDYAHTDDALRQVLSTLREITPGRLGVVFGCGGNRDRGKRELMGRVATELADVVVLTSDNPRGEEPEDILRDIEFGCAPRTNYRVLVNRTEAIRHALEWAMPGDVVLVAGKGHETFQEIGPRVIPFDDRLVVRQQLERMLRHAPPST